MKQQALQAICSEVYHRFPEVSGVKPAVSAYSGEQKLLVFQGTVKTADGHSLSRTVRVVADSDGKIIKLTTSR
jgi:hypothetical protein